MKAKMDELGRVWKITQGLFLLFLALYGVIYFALGALSAAAFYAFTAFGIVTVVALIVGFVQRNWFTILVDGVLAFFIIMDYVVKAGMY
jgi:hypothetical protein